MLKKRIKALFKPVADVFVKNEFCWRFISFFIRGSEWLKYERGRYERKKAQEKLHIFFNDRKVSNGFFKGLQYPSFESAGSSMFPKLLGSYESELFPVFESLKNKNYQQIIDVGCAEGYYAVGLAARFKQSLIYAYDTDKHALELCGEMAKLNGVSQRVTLHDTCTAAMLEQFVFTGKSLIVSDCEGYEKELFNQSNIHNLSHTDLIIELHPFAANEVEGYLQELFSKTHALQLISSHDNGRKIFDFENDLAKLNALEKLIAVEEGRPFTMNWLVCIAKS